MTFLRMGRASFLILSPLVVIAGCSSSSATSPDSGVTHPTPGTDGGTKDSGASKDSGATKDTGASGDAGQMTIMTIEALRQASPAPTGAVTVKGFVTALAGVPMDYPNWYIEDPAGGAYSGIDIYCDPAYSCTVPEPALNNFIQITGTLDPYNGQIELKPTAITILQTMPAAPSPAMVPMTEVAPGKSSSYRGVFVELTFPSKLTVDSVTPATLFDTKCGTPPVDGGAADAALPTCSPACEPPIYAGFRANDGAGNEVYIEAPFFNTDPLQSSPECLTQSGIVPVKVGMTFSKMSGILDVDPHSGLQAVSPVLSTNYATP